jgi:DNA-binding transcriptional LysR family regulator
MISQVLMPLLHSLGVDLRQLEAFEAVDRTGSYQRAATELHLSQPALWRQVRALENELRVPLFQRVGRAVRTTAAGAELAEAARDVLARAGRLMTTAAALEAGQRGRVRVACMAPHVPRVLAPAIGRLRDTEPDIEVALLEGAAGSNGVDFDALLASGEVDLAIGIPSRRASRRKLYDAEVVVGVSDGHPWLERDSVDIRELRGERLLVAPPGWLSRTQLEAAALSAGFQIDAAFESGTAATLVALAEAGVGVVVIADDAGAPITFDWPCLTSRRRVLSSPVEIFWHPDRPLSSASRAVLDAID